MKSVVNILLSVKNVHTKWILCKYFKNRHLLADNVGFYYNLNEYKRVYIY